MKKYIKLFLFIFLFSFFSSLPLTAAQWGIKEDYERPRVQKTLLEKLLSGDTIYYLLEQQEGNLPLTPEERKFQTDLLSQAINAWPTHVLQQIEKSGRAEEFADILPLLQKKARLEETSVHKDADIQLLLATSEHLEKLCSEDAEGCILFEKLIVIPRAISYASGTNNYEKLLSILIHEVGHSLGLADQYYQGAEQNASATHSSSNRIDSYDAIMSYADSLACDDVDGFINLMDLTLKNRYGSFNERAQKGWKSFCDDTVYKNAKVLNRKKYTIGNRSYEYDEEGNIKHTKYQLPFFYHEKPLTPLQNNRYLMEVWHEYWTLQIGEKEITFKNGEHFLTAERTTDASGVTWRFPFLEESGAVSLTEKNCISLLYADKTLYVQAFFNEQDKILSTMTVFWNHTNMGKNSVIDTLLTNEGSPIEAVLNSTPAFQQQGVCKFEYNFAPLLTVEQGKIVSRNEQNMNKLSRENKIPLTAIVINALQVCDKMKKTEQDYKRYLEDTKHICKFFQKMEKEFYN